MLTLLRTYYDDCTTGVLLDENGKFLCFILERPWLNNQSNSLVLPQNNSSCIPEGTYNVGKYISPTKKPANVFLFQNVHDRSNIEWHSANEVNQLLGCGAVGDAILQNISYKGIAYPHWVSNSVATLEKLNQILPNNFLVEIKSV